MKAVIYSYGLFILANILDILSSLGQLEQNPYMRNEMGVFLLSHAVVIKAIYVCVYATIGFVLYELGKTWDKRLGFMLAAAVPMYDSLDLLHVVFHNVLGRLNWFQV